MNSHNRKSRSNGKKVKGGSSEYNAYQQSEFATSGGKRRFGGRGLITDMAIPAILLYANNTIGKSKSVKSHKSGKSYKSRKTNKRKTRFTRRNR